VSREYIKYRLEQSEEKRRLAAEEEAKKEAEMEAERLRQKQILEAQETERLRQKNIQEKEKLAEQKWNAQVDNLLVQIKKDLAQEDNKLEEIRIIIQNRDPSLQELDWVNWLSDPLNQKLAELDLEQAMEMFKRDNLLAKRRKRRRSSDARSYKLAFSGDRSGATDSYATTTFTPSDYSLEDGFTISFWARPDEPMNQIQHFLGSRHTSDGGNVEFTFGVHSNGNIHIKVGEKFVTGIDNPMEVGKWYNWVFTYTGEDSTRDFADSGEDERYMRLWVNNDPRMTVNTNSRWRYPHNTPIYFGGRNNEGEGYGNGFACALTNVAIYNTSFDIDGTFANEIYNGGINYDHSQNGKSGLVGYWKFSEGNRRRIADTSGNGNHGTFGAIAGNTTAYPTWVVD